LGLPIAIKGQAYWRGLRKSAVGQGRRAAGPPEDITLYCARHDFGSYLLSKTGNLKAMMDTMGHADVKSAMTYQHPEMELVRASINARDIHGTPTQTLTRQVVDF
jgi:site-specific recombinase XerD